MFDEKAFAEKMDELGMSISSISKKSGISYKALYPKIKGTVGWTFEQADRVAEAMRLSHEDKVRIFMPD